MNQIFSCFVFTLILNVAIQEIRAAPGQPGTPKVKKVTNSEIHLVWEAPAPDVVEKRSGLETIQCYQVSAKWTESHSEDEWVPCFCTNTNSYCTVERECVISKIRAGLGFHFRVRAVNDEVGDYSDPTEAIRIQWSENIPVISASAPSPWKNDDSQGIESGYTRSDSLRNFKTCYHSDRKGNGKPKLNEAAYLTIPWSEVTQVTLLRRTAKKHKNDKKINWKGGNVEVCNGEKLADNECKECVAQRDGTIKTELGGERQWLPYHCPIGTEGDTIKVYHQTHFTIFCDVKVTGRELEWYEVSAPWWPGSQYEESVPGSSEYEQDEDEKKSAQNEDKKEDINQDLDWTHECPQQLLVTGTDAKVQMCDGLYTGVDDRRFEIPVWHNWYKDVYIFEHRVVNDSYHSQPKSYYAFLTGIKFRNWIRTQSLQALVIAELPESGGLDPTCPNSANLHYWVPKTEDMQTQHAQPFPLSPYIWIETTIFNVQEFTGEVVEAKFGEVVTLKWTFPVENNMFISLNSAIVTKDGNWLTNPDYSFFNHPYDEDIPGDTAFSRFLLGVAVKSDNDYGVYQLEVEGYSPQILLTPGNSCSKEDSDSYCLHDGICFMTRTIDTHYVKACRCDPERGFRGKRCERPMASHARRKRHATSKFLN